MPFSAGSDTTVGTPGGTYTTGTFTYSSTIDSISNLFARYSYDTALTNLPILVVMHGYNQAVSDFNTGVFDRMAGYKFFVVAVGMRGRDGASGSKDSSGREIYDIIDAVNHVRAMFPTKVDPNKTAIVGYSGGGANALAAACKFPDFFSVTADCFGIADYGEDATNGWYYTNVSFQADIEGQIGGDPTTYPDRYKARNALSAISNYEGYIYIFHDTSDNAVDVINSQLLDAELTANRFGLHTYYESEPLDAMRWTHGLPGVSGEAINSAEDYFKVLARNAEKPTMPTSGTLTVLGYVVTDDFSVWLGTGIDEVATLTYDISTGEFTVTPSTGAMTVQITFGDLVHDATISGATDFLMVDSQSVVSRFSDFIVAKLIDYMDGTGAAYFAATPAFTAALWNNDPGTDGAGGYEITGTINTTRQTVAFSNSGTDQVDNDAEINFGTASGDGLVTHVALFDGTDMVYKTSLATPVNVRSGKQVVIAAGAFKVNFL